MVDFPFEPKTSGRQPRGIESDPDTSIPAVDPVCGMTVVPQRAAAQAEHDGKTYFFCSVGCSKKFQADPMRFLSGRAAAPRPQRPASLSMLHGIAPARAAT